MRTWLLPVLYCVYGLAGLLLLSSVAPELLGKQALAFVLGGLSILLIAHISAHHFFTRPWLWYGLSVVGLLIPLLLPTSKTTHRWIDLPGFSFQPSQIVFVLSLFALSVWLVRYPAHRLKHVLALAVLLAVPSMLIFLEPNLGTTLLYVSTMAIVIFTAGLPWKYVVGAMAAVLVIGLISWTVLFKPYQKERIVSFIDPTAQTAASYNATQALIALGSGGLLGQGVGKGYQSQLKFLPESHTDFIFAVAGEEFGLVGSVSILLGYGLLIGFLLLQTAHTQTPERSVLIGAAALFLLQVTFNVGANVRLLPITGVPLPLLSYGGSSLLTFGVLLGVCQSIIRSQPPQAKLLIE